MNNENDTATERNGARLAGHSLIGEGAPHNWQGDRMHRQVGPTPGFGKCSCGYVSDERLPSDGARKRWHRDHKQAIRQVVSDDVA